MGRNVYSIVLDDEVVQAVDLAAHRAGSSRSAMINRLLAQQLEFATPESRVQDVFTAMQQLAAQQTQLILSQSATDFQLALRSALRYKYNPTVRYVLELYPHSEDSLGVLRVQLRTQSESLLDYLGQFYWLWKKLEAVHLGSSDIRYEIADARFARTLRLPVHPLGAEDMGEALSSYITLFDDCLKLFFEHRDDANLAVSETREYYGDHLNDSFSFL